MRRYLLSILIIISLIGFQVIFPFIPVTQLAPAYYEPDAPETIYVQLNPTSDMMREFEITQKSHINEIIAIINSESTKIDQKINSLAKIDKIFIYSYSNMHIISFDANMIATMLLKSESLQEKLIEIAWELDLYDKKIYTYTLEYNGSEISYKLYPNNIQVIDSYNIADYEDISYLLEIFRCKAAEHGFIYRRSKLSWISEWLAHNWLYTNGIATSQTDCSDFDEGEPIWHEIAYAAISIFNLLFC